MNTGSTTETPLFPIIHERIMTRNDSYAFGRKITPKGIMIHSTATPGVMASKWFDRWNKSYKAGETTRQVSVHAFVDDNEIWQYLPWNQRAWHAGGKANDTHIAFEICEPCGFRYVGGSKMEGYDAQQHEPYFRAAWSNAVSLCAFLCRNYGLTGQDILCHCEGYWRGVASNHADVLHWFPKHGESMESFRAAVKIAIGVPEQADYPRYIVRKGDSLWGIARDRLGSGQRYKEIVTLNLLLTDTIHTGDVLLLPE